MSPKMPSIANQNTLLLAVFIGMIVFGIRRGAEKAFPSLKQSFWWNDIFLYFFPILAGGVLGVIFPKFGSISVPEIYTSSVDRAQWGAVAGGLSGFAFKIYRNMQKSAGSKITSGNAEGS